MFTAPADRLVLVRRARRGGFTLLEITLAVAILAMMSLAIYRFVQTNLIALRVSSEQSVTEGRYDGFLGMLTAQWQALPANRGALLGEPFKFEGRERDEITWRCGAGPGLLTRYAAGEYFVTMRMRPSPKPNGTSSDRMEIGIARKPVLSGDTDANVNWAPLVPDVQTLEIRYFDPRLNAWVDRWTDTSFLPRLVRLTIGRADAPAPWVAVVALGRTPL